jgi:GNAT superfamily N-acetyltransferase
MDLAGAVEVFVRGFSFTRSFTYPYEAVRVHGLWAMRDAPLRKGDPRMQEIVAQGLTVNEALEALRAYAPPRHGFCFVADLVEDHESIKNQIKAAGYRLLRREPMFVCPTTAGTPDPRVRRVLGAEDSEAVARGAGTKQIPDRFLTPDAEVRLYAAFENGEVQGYVRSNTVGLDAWTSNMVVLPEHRRKGLGTALLQTMLAEDAKRGVENSVLLSTILGSKLYPKVGYQQIGLLQLFTPKRVL